MAKSIILNDLITELGMSLNSFEKAIGAGQGLIGKAIRDNKDITSNTIGKIIRKFPDVSESWLETGRGEMFNKTLSGPEEVKKSTENIQPDYKEKYIASLTEINQMLRDQVKEARAREEKLLSFGDVQRNLLTVENRMFAIQELTIRHLSKIQKRSPQELMAELGNIERAIYDQQKNEGNPVKTNK